MLTYCNLVITYHSLVFYHLAQCGRVSFDRLERSRSRIRDCLYAVEGKPRTKTQCGNMPAREAPLFSIAARIASSARRCSFGRSAPVIGSFIPLTRVAVRSSRSSISLRSASLLSPDNLRLVSFWSLAPECVCAAGGSL